LVKTLSVLVDRWCALAVIIIRLRTPTSWKADGIIRSDTKMHTCEQPG